MEEKSPLYLIEVKMDRWQNKWQTVMVCSDEPFGLTELALYRQVAAEFEFDWLHRLVKIEINQPCFAAEVIDGEDD